MSANTWTRVYWRCDGPQGLLVGTYETNGDTNYGFVPPSHPWTQINEAQYRALSLQLAQARSALLSETVTP